MRTQLFLSFALILLTTALFAETNTPEEKNEEPKFSVWKMKVGDLDFTCIEDHQREIDHSAFDGKDQREVQKLLPAGKSPGSNLLFVIEKGEQTVLIDSGIHGKLPKRLKAIGLAPDDFNAVLLTHVHISPIGGLIRGETPVYPNASLWLSSREADALKQKWSNEGGFYDKCDKAYGGIKRIEPDEKTSIYLDEITPLDLAGHSPGHMGFLIRSKDKHVAVVGDLLFCGDVQFQRPDINSSTDEDKEQAVATRKRILKRAADDRWIIAGSRLPFPGVGRVEVDGDGFRFLPLSPDEGETIPDPL